MSLVKEYASVKVTRSGKELTKDPVLVEQTIELLVNGTRLSSIVTTGEAHKELAAGYLVTEGAVKSRDDIISVKEAGNKVDVEVRNFEGYGHCLELRSAGIGIKWELREENIIIPVEQTYNIGVILDSLKYLFSDIHDMTRGAHTACIVDTEGRLVYKALDVGRHNAVDKVIGSAILAKKDLSKVFLLSSGRQPSGMVMKAVRAGVPLVVSKAAPISSGIDCAIKANITLACFADKEKIKVFSCPGRIIL
jgi:FdhD protein